MKVVPPKDNGASSKKKPLLPLVPDTEDELNSSNSVSYSLRVTPSDADSPTYKKYVRVLTGSEDVRTVLTWVADTALVITGLNITSPANAYTLLTNLVKGSAKTIYTEYVDVKCRSLKQDQVDAEADATRKATLQARAPLEFLDARTLREAKRALIQGIVPNKIVAMVKRYLRRECRKPADMKVRAYYQHLLRINNDELPALPPFNPAQNMSDDELIDILIYATPKSWMREMDRQGFDPVTKTLQEVVTFMERIEQSEDFDGQRVDHSQKGSSSSPNKNKKAKTKGGSPGSKYCMVHGRCSHSSEECDVLKKRAEEYKSGKTDTKGRFGNKTWSRKANESTKSSQKDLAAFIKKAVAHGVKKELNSVDKKRKAKDDDFDLNAFDEELKGFNYSAMDNLKIDSDDESSGEVSC